jgi:hypothetical protein
MRANIFARPEQTESTNVRFPLFAYAGRRAAESWITNASLSLCDFRDLCFRVLVAGDDTFPLDSERRAAFNNAFAGQIALSIARQSRAEVRHG